MSEFDYPPRYYDPPNLPWPDDRPPRSELNPYGYWNNQVGNKTNPLCRLTEPLYLCSLCDENTSADPEGFVRWFVILCHWAVFPVCIFALWVIYVKMDVLKERIYSPFLLLVGIMCLAIGSMSEVDNHSFALNWNACYDTAETLSKLYFYTFVGGGCACLPIGLRKKDLPLVRNPTGNFDWYCFLGDWILIIFTIVTPLAWVYKGQVLAQNIFIITQCAGLLIGVPYIFLHLGPSRMHLVVGFLSYLSAFVGAVPVNLLLRASGIQLVHGLLAVFFDGQVLGIMYCIYNMYDTPQYRQGGTGEDTPLV